MKYFEAPDKLDFDQPNFKEWENHREKMRGMHDSIFLAGSITAASNWQAEVKDRLLEKYHVVNPRRENFNVLDQAVEEEQITWEFHALNFCRSKLFYFAPETLAPITLFEYGNFIEKIYGDDDTLFDKYPVYVCIHPDYKRKRDVEIQTKLRDKEVYDNICYDLDTLVKVALDAAPKQHKR